ncbi:hypothetical protein CRYUN_Cryun41cG0028500 [Craigia yunnanensis]
MVDRLGGERDMEKGLVTPQLSQNSLMEASPTPSPSSTATAPALILSNSGKRIDRIGSSLTSCGSGITEHSATPSPSSTATAPALVLSNSGKRIDRMSSSLTSSSSGTAELSATPSPSSTVTAPALVLSNSGKRIDQACKKKYVKQVTGRHNDTELHLAAQRGDLAAVKQILADIDSQMMKTASGEDFDMEVSEIQASLVNEVNELGETSLFTAAEKGHLDVVQELLKYSNKETVTKKNKSGFDPLHIAASQGHHAIVQVLLDHDPNLCQTFGPSNATPLVSAATKGHTAVVNELLSRDGGLLESTRSNGKNALHLAARPGHVDVVKALLSKDPQLARRTDKKGQTALHMAVKGHSCEVVKLLLEADAAIVMLPDKFGNTALHVATRKKRAEIVNELLSLPDTNVNALTRDHKTALDIAEGLPLSAESSDIKSCLCRYGALRANELNQPRDELRQTVTQIKNDVHTQLEQTKRTNKNVHNISKELRKLHREGINNATNSVTVVAVLFATVAFAAIFTVPGGDHDSGVAVVCFVHAFFSCKNWKVMVYICIQYQLEYDSRYPVANTHKTASVLIWAITQPEHCPKSAQFDGFKPFTCFNCSSTSINSLALKCMNYLL